MKKGLLVLLCAFIYINSALAQPDKFNYQGIARDASGAPITNKQIALRVSFLVDTTAFYIETHEPTTSSNGLFTLNLGEGTVVSGTLINHNWSLGEHSLKVEIDPNGGSAYVDLGTTVLNSVPYAKQASSLKLFNSGTNNPEKVVIAHSDAYNDWGMFYNDSTDAFLFKNNNSTRLKINLSGGATLTIPQNAAAGRVLTSDANGNATWQNRKTLITAITPPGCFKLDTATTTFKKIANLGSFTKASSTSTIELTYQSFMIINYFSHTTGGLILELRIDSVASTLVGARYVYRNRSMYEFFNMNGIFDGIGAGVHTISLWARTNVGTARNIYFDDGCWNASKVNSLLIKEYE